MEGLTGKARIKMKRIFITEFLAVGFGVAITRGAGLVDGIYGPVLVRNHTVRGDRRPDCLLNFACSPVVPGMNGAGKAQRPLALRTTVAIKKVGGSRRDGTDFPIARKHSSRRALQ
jgi:hypothetical protein